MKILRRFFALFLTCPTWTLLLAITYGSIGYSACQTPEEGANSEFFSITPLPYDLSQPEAIYRLPDELIEASGLAWIDTGLVAIVEDEHARIYVFDEKVNEVVHEVEFDKDDGDFEGIAVRGTTAYVLRSDGDVFEVPNFLEEDEVDAEKWENELSDDNNTEGLCLSSDTTSLYIACKGSPDTDKVDYKDARAVYTFDLATREVSNLAFLVIYRETLERLLDSDALSETARELMLGLGKDVTFRPSAIDRHPVSGAFYLLSSIGKRILVLNEDGDILHFASLDPRLFNHPEGICFAPDGTLYIANEGDGDVARLLKYAPGQ